MKNAKELNNIVKMLEADDTETRKMGQGIFETLNEEERALIDLHYANSIIRDRQQDMSIEDILKAYNTQGIMLEDPSRRTYLIPNRNV